MTDQEINQAVHRKLGWKCGETRKEIGGSSVGPVPPYTVCGECFAPWPLGEMHPHPNYCYSIEAAWTIVDEFKRKGYVMTLSQNFNEKYEWNCEINDPNEPPKLQSQIGQSETAPEAICLAFLKIT